VIDLHSHTNESDGTLTPAELVALALKAGLEAIAITDHDTFAGYEQAVPFAAQSGLELVRGIELNSRMEAGDARGRSVHVLAYFPLGEAGPSFTDWLQSQREERRERNAKLADRLREQGINITLREVEAKGKSLVRILPAFSSRRVM
jgi:3',5'-nucleoside bisphosphate phosphatase